MLLLLARLFSVILCFSDLADEAENHPKFGIASFSKSLGYIIVNGKRFLKICK